MGGYTQLFLVFIFMAAVFTAHQKTQIANLRAPFPPRQIAYQMRLYHQGSLNFKALPANQGVTGIISSPPPSQSGQSNFTSCADAKSVVTFVGGASAGAGWQAGLGAYENAAVAGEIARQSLVPPETAPVGMSPLAIGYGSSTVPQVIPVPGVGLSTGTAIQSGAGLVALPAGCSVPAGLPAIQTQVLP